MASLSKLLLIGNLGADPDVRYLPSGDAVVTFNLATSDRRSDGKGGHIVVTDWHRVALYGKLAEVAGRLLRKGSQVYVEGKLRGATFTGRDGVVRKSWTLIGDRMQLLGRKSERVQVNSEGDDLEWMDQEPPGATPRGNEQFKMLGYEGDDAF